MAQTTKFNSKIAKTSGSKSNNSISGSRASIPLVAHTFPTRYEKALASSDFVGLTAIDINVIVGFFVSNSALSWAVDRENINENDSKFFFPDYSARFGYVELSYVEEIRALGRTAIVHNVGSENIYITGRQLFYIKVGNARAFRVGLNDLSTFSFN